MIKNTKGKLAKTNIFTVKYIFELIKMMIRYRMLVIKLERNIKGINTKTGKEYMSNFGL